MPTVLIAGGGPAAIAAGISAVCAGLQATVIAPDFGGRYYESPRLENVPGFPLGVSGGVFAERHIEQARRLGVAFIEGRMERISEGHYTNNTLIATCSLVEDPDDTHLLEADAIVLATGMRMTHSEWHRPEAPGPGAEAVVVGGGDAAAQVALGHASQGTPTVMVLRGEGLSACSPYLRARVQAEPNITLLTRSEVVRVGDATTSVKTPEGLRILNGTPCMLIGASVDVSWANVATDGQGFVLTDSSFATSRRHVYAVGDVRATSIKRIAVAAGEGTAVGFIIARTFAQEG